MFLVASILPAILGIIYLFATLNVLKKKKKLLYLYTLLSLFFFLNSLIFFGFYILDTDLITVGVIGLFLISMLLIAYLIIYMSKIIPLAEQFLLMESKDLRSPENKKKTLSEEDFEKRAARNRGVQYLLQGEIMDNIQTNLNDYREKRHLKVR